MSQSFRQIGRPDLNAFFFFKCFFFFFFFFSEQQTCQIWVGHNFVQNEIPGMKYGTWLMDEEKEAVCCSKCFIMYVISFHVDFGM